MSCVSIRKAELEARYDEFIHFPNYRFASMDVSEYLGYPVTMDHERKTVKYDFLERLHGQVSW